MAYWLPRLCSVLVLQHETRNKNHRVFVSPSLYIYIYMYADRIYLSLEFRLETRLNVGINRAGLNEHFSSLSRNIPPRSNIHRPSERRDPRSTKTWETSFPKKFIWPWQGRREEISRRHSIRETARRARKLANVISRNASIDIRSRSFLWLCLGIRATPKQKEEGSWTLEKRRWKRGGEKTAS